jgi:hypothetical protein
MTSNRWTDHIYNRIPQYDTLNLGQWNQLERYVIQTVQQEGLNYDNMVAAGGGNQRARSRLSASSFVFVGVRYAKQGATAEERGSNAVVPRPSHMFTLLILPRNIVAATKAGGKLSPSPPSTASTNAFGAVIGNRVRLAWAKNTSPALPNSGGILNYVEYSMTQLTSNDGQEVQRAMSDYGIERLAQNALPFQRPPTPALFSKTPNPNHFSLEERSKVTNATTSPRKSTSTNRNFHVLGIADYGAVEDLDSLCPDLTNATNSTTNITSSKWL